MIFHLPLALSSSMYDCLLLYTVTLFKSLSLLSVANACKTLWGSGIFSSFAIISAAVEAPLNAASGKLLPVKRATRLIIYHSKVSELEQRKSMEKGRLDKYLKFPI